MAKNDVIRTGESLTSILERIVEKSIKSKLHRAALSEKDNQDATAKSLDPDSNTDDEVEQVPSKTMAVSDSDDEVMKTGDVTADSIISKLNAIRSGKSFRDDGVKSSMEEYVKSLSKAERTALLAFLKGISQIVTGEVDGQQAVDPADSAPAVSMEKSGVNNDSTGSKKTIKPNVIVKRGAEVPKKPSAEDTSAPAALPIKAKR